MAGTRSVGTINGTPSYKSVLVRFIDVTGDVRGISFKAPNDITDAEIEAIVAASQAKTYASIFEVQVSDVYFSKPNKGNADLTADANLASVYDNIVFMYQDDTRTAQRWYQPAPTADCFETATDNPDYLGVVALADAVGNGLGGSFSIVSLRYTERREINERVPV